MTDQYTLMKGCNYPDSNVHEPNIGPIWVLSAPDGPHAGPMNLAIRVVPIETNTAHIGTALACSYLDACTKWLWFYSKNSKSILLKERNCFLFRFHSSLFLGFKWWYLIIGSGIGLVQNRQQTITHGNVDPALCFHMAPFSRNEVMTFSCMRSGYILIGCCLISSNNNVWHT